MSAEVAQEFVPLHSTANSSRRAVAGSPRSASSRWSSKIKSMAETKLSVDDGVDDES